LVNIYSDADKIVQISRAVGLQSGLLNFSVCQLSQRKLCETDRSRLFD